jgi:glycine/D-amino acid oxidase-like deaminating enzyme
VLDPGISEDLDRRPDVLVVGGGVVGLAAAFFCREAGLGRVQLIEADRLASAASGGAGGALAPEVHHLTDPPAFVALARSSLALYHQLAREWDDGPLLWPTAGLVLLPDGPPPRLRPWPQVELLDAGQVAELVPELVLMPAALLARDQARVHPLRLAAALARRAGRVATAVACGSRPVPIPRSSAPSGYSSVSFTLDRHGHLYPEADSALRDRPGPKGEP